MHSGTQSQPSSIPSFHRHSVSDADMRAIELSQLRISPLLLGTCGTWLILLGAYFVFLRPPLLAEDLRYIAITEIYAGSAVPALASWLKLVFIVLGGFAASTGVALTYLSIWILPRRPKGAGLAVAAVIILGPALMCVVNFALHSTFRWLLLAPVIVGIAGVLMYIRGR
jgi:hypothetical protein